MANEIVNIKSINSFELGGYTVNTRFNIKQYYEFTDVFVVREEDANGNGYLFAYGYMKDDFKIIWQFPYDDVVSIEREVPAKKKESEFVTPDHYIKYIEKYAGKELLIVYAGNFRYRIDGNTGEIYDKVQSR